MFYVNICYKCEGKTLEMTLSFVAETSGSSLRTLMPEKIGAFAYVIFILKIAIYGKGIQGLF